jgi:hypothetical protein
MRSSARSVITPRPRPKQNVGKEASSRYLFPSICFSGFPCAFRTDYFPSLLHPSTVLPIFVVDLFDIASSQQHQTSW